MTAALTLRIDPASGEFRPAELRLRVRGPDGEVLNQDPVVTAIELSPPDLVTVTPIGDPTPGMLAYRCEVDPAAVGRDTELVAGGTSSVTMTIRALPGDGHQQPLVATCPIEVVVPGPTIRWYTNGDGASVGRPGHVEATANAELTLRVSLEQFSPSEGRLATVDDAMFSHMVNVGPDGQTAFTSTVFGVHPSARPWEAPPGSRCDVSRWRLSTDLPPEGRPDLAAPSTTFIRVRAWKAGVITARFPDRITASEAHVAECFVPVQFAPVDVTAELIDPPMPIPADGRQVELVVAVRRAGADEPAAGVPVALSLRHHADAEGSLDPAATSITSDDHGLVHVTYITPALTYRSGGRYLEELVVARAGDGSTDEIAAFPLHLNPELLAELHVAKDGLEFDSVRIHRTAGRTPATVGGHVWLTVENRLVRGEQRSPVEHAEARLVPAAETGSGGAPATEQDGHTCRSGDLGAIGFTLDELRAGWAAADEERRREVDTTLDPDGEVPSGRFDADVTLVIDRYDDRVGPQTWLARCGALTDRRMATQRLTLGDQLARRPETDLARAVSGTLLLERATHIPPLVDRRYRQYWTRVAEHLGGLFDELVSMAMTVTQVASKVAEFGTKVLSTTVSATATVIGRALAGLGSVLGRVFGSLVGALQSLLAGIGNAFPALRTAVDTLVSSVSLILGKISRGSGSTARDLVEYCAELFRLVAGFFRNLARTLLALAGWLLSLLGTGARSLADRFADGLPWVAELSRDAVDAAARVVGSALRSAGVVEGIGHFVGQDFTARLQRISDQLWSGPSSAHADDPAPRVAGARTAPGLSGRIAASLRDQLDHTHEVSGRALDFVCERVDELSVPESPHVARQRAQGRAASIQGAAVTNAAIFDTFAVPIQVLDTLYTCTKVVMVAMVGAATVVGGVAIAPLLQAIDLAYAKAKACLLHVPAATSAAVLAIGSIVAGYLIITDLPSTSGTTP